MIGIPWEERVAKNLPIHDGQPARGCVPPTAGGPGCNDHLGQAVTIQVSRGRGRRRRPAHRHQIRRNRSRGVPIDFEERPRQRVGRPTRNDLHPAVAVQVREDRLATSPGAAPGHQDPERRGIIVPVRQLRAVRVHGVDGAVQGLKDDLGDPVAVNVADARGRGDRGWGREKGVAGGGIQIGIAKIGAVRFEDIERARIVEALDGNDQLRLLITVQVIGEGRYPAVSRAPSDHDRPTRLQPLEGDVERHEAFGGADVRDRDPGADVAVRLRGRRGVWGPSVAPPRAKYVVRAAPVEPARRIVEILDAVRFDEVDSLAVAVPVHDVELESRVDLRLVDVVGEDPGPRSVTGQEEVELRPLIAVGVEIERTVTVHVIEGEGAVPIQVLPSILEEKVLGLRYGNLDEPGVHADGALDLRERNGLVGADQRRPDEVQGRLAPGARLAGDKSVRVPDARGHDVPGSQPLGEAVQVAGGVVEIGKPELMPELVTGDPGHPEDVAILTLRLR